MTYQSGDSALAESFSSFEASGVPVAPLHHVSLVLAEQGGVHATYYNAANFTAPSRASLATRLEMSVDSASPLATACVIAGSSFAARFRGMLRPPGQQRYTFTASVAGPQQHERVRLWLDNKLLIDQWSSLSTLTPTGVLQLGDAGSRSLHDLRLEFKGGNDELNSSASMPPCISNMSLKMAYDESPFASTLPSASNPLPIIRTSPLPIPAEYLMHAYPLSMRTSAGGGISASYYSDSANASSVLGADCTRDLTACIAWGAPRKSCIDTSIDWSAVLGAAGASQQGPPYAQSLGGAGAFAARWSGFISPSLQAVYTFYARLHGRNNGTSTSERLSLWVDNQEIISQWSSLRALIPSGTIRLDAGDRFYGIAIEYKSPFDGSNTAINGLSLLWSSQGSFPNARKISRESLLRSATHQPSPAASVPSAHDTDAAEFPFSSFYSRQEYLAAAMGGDLEEVEMQVVAPRHYHQPQTRAFFERDDFMQWDTDRYDSSQAQLENSQRLRNDMWSATGACPAVAGKRLRGLIINVNNVCMHHM
jgi:hypothetical protein